jgi:hypothetical protein
MKGDKAEARAQNDPMSKPENHGGQVEWWSGRGRAGIERRRERRNRFSYSFFVPCPPLNPASKLPTASFSLFFIFLLPFCLSDQNLRLSA